MLRSTAVLVATLLLAGCVPAEPVITPAPEPSTTPIFASDEEALAAATDAYAKYLEVSDAITSDGGLGVDRVSTLVTAEQFVNEVAAFKDFSEVGLHTSGDSAADVVGLQSYWTAADETSKIVIYVCVHVSEVRILDSSNEDVTPTSRPNTYPLEVEFEVTPGTPSVLKISRSEKWSGNDFCQS